MSTFEDNAELLDVTSILFDTYWVESGKLLSYESSVITFKLLIAKSKIYMMVFIDSLVFLDQEKIAEAI